MSAPNLMRVGTPENVFVECQDCTGGDVTVEIVVRNHPTKNTRLTSTTVTLTSGKHFQGLGQITVLYMKYICICIHYLALFLMTATNKRSITKVHKIFFVLLSHTAYVSVLVSDPCW